MAHAGLFLFAATVLLAALSRAWLHRFKRSRDHSGVVNIHASASEIDPHAAAVGGRGIESTAFMRVLVSLLVLSAALFIILSKQYDGDQQKWAFGAIGTVLGYWLKA